MGEWITIPELAEHHHPNDSAGIPGARSALQANGHITTARINKALAKSSAETGHWVLMFVTSDFGISCSNRGQRRGGGIRLLHKDHSKSNECPLPNEVYTVLRHRFENFDSVLKPRSGTGNAKSKCRTAPNMGIIALTEELYYPRDLTGVLEE